MNNYPTNRKPKLSDSRDQEFYPKTYMKEDARGTRRRYIKGQCTECHGQVEIVWGNFTRKRRKFPYTFIHYKCGQIKWNREQERRRNSRPTEEVYRTIYSKYRSSAKYRKKSTGEIKEKYTFELTFEQFCDIIQKNCAYCGRAPRPHDRWTHVNYNGVDRMDNVVGYTLQNSAACCTRCNFIKGSTDWITWVEFLNEVKENWPIKSLG